VLADNLGLLLKLYRHPRAAMSDIIDQASILFGAGAVLVVAALLLAGTVSRLADALPGQVAASSGEAAEADGQGPAVPAPGAPAAPAPPAPMAPVLALATGTSVFSTVFALALLYAPATLLLVTIFEPVGSFGVAFRRDYGSLLACTFMAWAAGHLPFAILGLALSAGAVPLTAVAALAAGGALLFGFFMVCAVRTLFGARLGSALAVVALSWLSLLLEPFLLFAASPFVLFWAWQLFSRDVGAVTFSFGARQSFKRHLEAATINPRDAGAHYQLGLIHQQRGQDVEAIARFQKAVEIDPSGELDAHFQLGRIARKQGRHADALKHLDAVLSRDPKHSRHDAWREAGGTYLDSGDHEHARWALERFVEQRPHDPEGLYQLGAALSSLGQGEAARALFQRCVEAADTMPRYLRHEVRRWRKLARQRLSEAP
jgi:tetratricopeptide (TPR) repeat protein